LLQLKVDLLQKEELVIQTLKNCLLTIKKNQKQMQLRMLSATEDSKLSATQVGKVEN